MAKKFVTPKEIYTGAGAIYECCEQLSALGKKPLVVTSAGTWERMGEKINTILDKCFKAFEVFDRICQEPDDIMITEGVKAYIEKECDCLIGIGGGSPLDAMKAIGVMSCSSGSISDYMGWEITVDMPKMAAIPTTAGTGSEATKFTIITDTKTDVKMLLRGDVLLPDIAIVDPVLTESSPKQVTASTGLDALTHAIEAYTSKQSQPLTDALALSAVKRIFEFLPRAYSKGSDKEAREQMSYAALEAGICINNSSVTIVHGMSRPIGALFHVPHGLSNAMLLTKCLEFALSGCYERFGDLGRAIGAAPEGASDKESAEAFIAELNKLCRICKVPTLSDYGIEKEKFFDVIEKMAIDAVASGSPGNTRIEVTQEDCCRLYKSLWE